uniref:Uncharacterized protein LOC104213300 n=1 Tax=Nicotiana sylvestris TaxID=4096 RepID=A0A1U7UYH8_NICSY|nr:PREDICTED: uncharacterized protein LOC104213300 [Nicotiana sylvestris]
MVSGAQLLQRACSHNFSLWKAQMSMLMHGHNLFGHLDGSKPTPSQTISANNQASSRPSRRLSKDSRPIVDYLHQVRSLCVELATAGSPVSNEELVVKILTGLGSEFRGLFAAIRARDSTISYEELYEKLLYYELFLHHEEAKRTPFAPITANIAQGTASTPTRQGSNNNRRSNAPNNNNLNQQSHNQAWRNNQQPRRNNQQQQPPNNNIYRQLCDGRGHTARVCRTRSHNHFQARANYAARFQNQ